MLSSKTHPHLNRAARRHPAKHAAQYNPAPANAGSPLLQSLFVNAGLMVPEQDLSLPSRAGAANTGVPQQSKSTLQRLRGWLKLTS